MLNPTLELDLLRTLVLGTQSGSFQEAAALVGRTQSAVSLQMRRLENQVGVRLLEKSGRKLALTNAGEVLLEYAKRLLALNDEALQAAAGVNLKGKVRVGLLQDFAETILPSTLAAFSRSQPAVEIGVQVESSRHLIEAVRQQRIDLALLFVRPGDPIDLPATRIASVPMVWVLKKDAPPASPRLRRTGLRDPLKLVLFPPPCLFREVATENLEKANRPWRQVFVSPSLAGAWAAVEAGLGLSVRTRIGLPRNLTAVHSLPGTRKLPSVDIMALEHQSPATPVVSRLRDLFVETLQAHLVTQSSIVARSES
jgi:DNA-binding transcriptional LysR family regulator